MPENILEVEKEYFHLWIDLDVKLMYTEWLQKPTSQEYSEACDLFLALVRQYKVENWIADSKQLTGLPLDVQQTVIKQLTHLLVNSSLKKQARIIDKDFNSFLLFEEIFNSLKANHQWDIEIQQFITFEDAADWIGMIRG